MWNANARVRVLIPAEALAARISELAAQISRDHAQTERLVVIGVLKGSVLFLADLIKQITVPVELDFCQTASYGSGQEPGEIHLKKDVELPLRGADVLVVEDIVDTGWTLRTLLDLFRHRQPRSVRLCTLLDKAEAREVEVPIDYCGFRIPRQFVVGYGLDWGERYRQLPYIGVVESAPEETP
jgi:hypoxanthine phosphoribosyltransferase